MKAVLPNALTVFRLVAAMALPLAFVVLPRPLADWCALVLFVGAAITDWLDGRLARSWGQETRFGTMLDPIADKAMVALALLTLGALPHLSITILVPAGLILFREVFVSGLREYLGAAAGRLKVTPLAKWKTTVQMVAMSLLFAAGIAEHAVVARVQGQSPEMARAILAGDAADAAGLRPAAMAFDVLRLGGLTVLWAAAALTIVTGWDYFRKALPLLGDRR